MSLLHLFWDFFTIYFISKTPLCGISGVLEFISFCIIVKLLFVFLDQASLVNMDVCIGEVSFDYAH